MQWGSSTYFVSCISSAVMADTKPLCFSLVWVINSRNSCFIWDWWADKLLLHKTPSLTAQLAREVIWGHNAAHHCGRQMVTWCVFVSFDTTCVLRIITLSLSPARSSFFFLIYPSFPVGLLLSSVRSRSIAHVCLTFHTLPLLCLLRLWWIAFTGRIGLHSSPLLTDLTIMMFSPSINKVGFVLLRTTM